MTKHDSLNVSDLLTIGAVAVGVYFLVKAVQSKPPGPAGGSSSGAGAQPPPLAPDFGATDPESWD